MLARRVIALSADKAFGKQLAVALKAAGGAVDVHASLDELGAEVQAALVVVHVDGDLVGTSPQLLQRLTGETRVIAILPRSNLAAVVDIMQASERVAGMLVAEDLDTRQLSAMATRVIVGDIFGLDKHVLWGTQVHSQLVGDYQEKSLCIAQISEFAEMMGVRRKYREAIEQCIDEMLMNALYDAPVDDQGNQIFAEIPTKTRISLRVEQKAVVQYACDGKQFVVAVRDAFGTLERATVLRYLHKCLHNEQQIDRKAGGAGLGLYLMTSSSSRVLFNVLPGVATEAVCTFDLETPKLALEAFGYFTEKIDAAGRLVGGPSRRLPGTAGHPVERRSQASLPAPAMGKGVIAILIAAIVVTLGLIGIVAWPRLFPGDDPSATITIKSVPDATIQIAGVHVGTTSKDGVLVVRGVELGHPVAIVAERFGFETKQVIVEAQPTGTMVDLPLVGKIAKVQIRSNPVGAIIIHDGREVGTTPQELEGLPPGKTVTLTLRKSGYRDKVFSIEVPAAGDETGTSETLEVAENVALVHVESRPPGAQVYQNGVLVAGAVTPADVFVEAGKPVQFMLVLEGKVPAIVKSATYANGAKDGFERTLVDGKPLRITATVPGTASVADAPHCQGLALPATCTLAPGSYVVEVVVPQAARISRKVTLGDAPADVKVELGYVDAPPGAKIQLVGGPALPRVVLEVGPRRITVVDEAGASRVVDVVVRAGMIVRAP